MNTFLKKSWATPSEVMVFLQGERITPLVSPWSTVTMTESKPLQGGRSVMRSTEIWEKGRVADEGIGFSGGVEGWVLDFICWQRAQPSTYFRMYVPIPGHQKSRLTSSSVLSRPGCPAVGRS